MDTRPDIKRELDTRDWSRTSLGPQDKWPAPVRTLFDIMFRSAQPMFLIFGPDMSLFYNEAFVPVLGAKHPGAFGSPSREVWSEAWGDIEPMFNRVFAGESIKMENYSVDLDRGEGLKPAHFTFSHTPVFDGSDCVALFGVSIETTSRILAEKQLQLAIDNQKRMFEQSPGFLIITKGPEHVVEFVNDAHKAYFESGSWVGKTILEAVPNLREQGYVDIMDHVFTKGEAFEDSNAVFSMKKTPDSLPEDRRLTVVIAPIYDEHGSIIGIYSDSFDVTEGHRSQLRTQALVDLNDNIRDIEDPDELAYATAEMLGKLMGVSRAGYGTINTAEETITIERDWNAPGIKSLAGTLKFRDYGSYIDELKRGITVICSDAETDHRTVGAANSLKAISAQSFVNMPVTEQGDFVALLYLNHENPRDWSREEIAFISDVAQRTRTAVERRRAEASVRANEANLRFLDRLSQQTSLCEDPELILQITTRELAAHLGATSCAYADMDDDEDGMNIRGEWVAPGRPTLIGHHKLATYGEEIATAARGNKPYVLNDAETELAPETAAAFRTVGIASTVCMPLQKNGKLTGLMAVHNDTPVEWTSLKIGLIREVTERSWAHIERTRAAAKLRESVDALERLNATLEQKVEERSAELIETEEALRQSQKMEAVGQLTGGIAHDFNNILAGIASSLGLMQRRLAQGRMSEIGRYLNDAQAAASRAGSLTQRLLTFSRRQSLDPKSTDVRRLISDMSHLINSSVGPTIEIGLDLEEDIWPCFADAGQLENALLNLCLNARDAMPEGGRLQIESKNLTVDGSEASRLQLAPGKYIVLCVSDTGTGMTEKVIERAFDPFFTTKPLGQGTGLGLSMVYGFAGQSDGAVEILSQVDEGTTVRLYLPAAPDEAPSAENPPSDIDLTLSETSETVLVVDDEFLIRMNVVETLQDLGYTVVEAGDGPEAQEVFARHPEIKIVVTDVGLPKGMNGKQLVDHLRSSRPDLPVLFVTGYNDPDLMLREDDAATRVLNKPFNFDELARHVKELMPPA